MKLLDQCTNGFGEGLREDCLQRLRAVLDDPNQETWDAAFTIIITQYPQTTLWQAWVAVDPLAPPSKPLEGPWPRIPDQLMVARAIKWAINQPVPEWARKG
jgi:hypothetical protein